MSMRYLFHILTSIRDGNPSTAKDYRMPEEQFRASLDSFVKLGFLEPNRRQPLSPMSNGYILTPKGVKFLEEYKQLASEIPLVKRHLPHWVRFQGETYVVPGHAVKAVAPDRSVLSCEKMPGLIKATTKTCLNSRKGPSTAAVIWTAGCGIWIN
ncbi:hypothetical protein [Paenibacillus naphthalenovorans]|uniref:hypothetical protein n=1 Tax=Paenibacillus naphthalenovorans TaxID=162209 RepID=UPI003D27279D